MTSLYQYLQQDSPSKSIQIAHILVEWVVGRILQSRENYSCWQYKPGIRLLFSQGLTCPITRGSTYHHQPLCDIFLVKFHFLIAVINLKKNKLKIRLYLPDGYPIVYSSCQSGRVLFSCIVKCQQPSFELIVKGWGTTTFSWRPNQHVIHSYQALLD